MHKGLAEMAGLILVPAGENAHDTPCQLFPGPRFARIRGPRCIVIKDINGFVDEPRFRAVSYKRAARTFCSTSQP
jgi:hypothetical protein